MQKKQLWTMIKNKLHVIVKFFHEKNPINKEKILSLIIFLKRVCKSAFSYIRRSWKSIAVVVPVFLVLYYVIGGYVTNTIDKDTSVEIKSDDQGFDFVATGAFLIKREVDDHMWTPNLPFIFPGYVLDNMPSFQALKLLKYPTNIWILSKGENLALAPSSGAQYRKARKEMLNFNKNTDFAASDNKKVFLSFLTAMEKDLKKITDNIENQVREFSVDWIDFRADNIFYLNQGKIYGHYILLKAASQDFKHLIIETKQYEKLTSLLKYLEDAIMLNPIIVRNGQIESITGSNHLMVLNYYIAKSCYILNQIKDNIIRDVQ